MISVLRLECAAPLSRGITLSTDGGTGRQLAKSMRGASHASVNDESGAPWSTGVAARRRHRKHLLCA